MRRILMVELLAVVLLMGCKEKAEPRGSVEVKEGPGSRGSGEIIVVPALPSVVMLSAEPYYQHAGYFYFYQDNRWSYSQSRSGPWVALPSDRYPKEVRFVVPALPSIVVLSAEPYYQYAGYFYFYQDNRWSYSQSRSGPWVTLPSDRYPKEVKFKSQSAQQSQSTQQSKGEKQNKGEKRGHDKPDKHK